MFITTELWWFEICLAPILCVYDIRMKVLEVGVFPSRGIISKAFVKSAKSAMLPGKSRSKVCRASGY